MGNLLERGRLGLFVGLLLSIAFHVFMVWVLRFLPPVPEIPNQASRIEIEIKEPVTLKADQQKVRETFVPEDLKSRESEDPLTFFSAQNQRVKKQLRALVSGLTANRSEQSQNKNQDSPKKSELRKKDFFRLTAKESAIKVPRAQESSEGPTTNPLLQLPAGVSTVGEVLPDEMEIGSFTALNTDRYLYYSFFARVEELIRSEWENAVHNTIDRTPRAFFQTSLQRHWITQLDILLKPNGEFHKALLLKASGVDGFDWAAMDSFAAARIFPHPPKDMIEGDGYIHLRYSFNVYTHPKVLVKQ